MVTRRELIARGAVVLGTLGTGVVYGVRASAQDTNPDLPDHADIPPGTRHTELLMVPMRDGVRLATSLWLPEKEGRYPVILMRSLNRKVNSNPNRLAIIGKFIEAGYGFMGGDIRGRFESDGDFDEYDRAGHIARDGYDLIEWLADQSWCDGNIGTFGVSHMSGFQVQTAQEHPPHLKAMGTWSGGFEAMGLVEGAPPPMSGGAMQLITTLVWLPNEAAGELDRLEAQGQDMRAAKEALARMRTHPRETYMHLPLREAPVAQYGRLGELLKFRLERDVAPVLGPGTPPEAIAYPTFHECGWFDPVAWRQFDAFAKLRERAANEGAREGQYLTVGPWQHSLTFRPDLGEADFGPSVTNEGSGIDDRQIRFFDKYVRGIDRELAPVKYYVLGIGEWREAQNWPPPGTIRQKLYLHARSGANSVAGDGWLSADAPAGEAPDRFTYDPADPVPTVGGAMIGALQVEPKVGSGPMDQAEVEAREDVLVYTTGAYAHETEISGPVTLRLHVASSAVDTDFTAKLALVDRDGKSTNLIDSVLRMAGRNLTGTPEPLVPGQIYEVVMGVGQISVVVEPGQKLRLQVSSSNFPYVDRNMNTGNPIGTDEVGIVAQQTVYHDDQRQSYLELPVAPARA